MLRNQTKYKYKQKIMWQKLSGNKDKDTIKLVLRDREIFANRNMNLKKWYVSKGV